jgi:cellulose synthase/poly-beta-1,6-N-acetylglucosamine synthase-like glycosyltransferase
VAGEHSALMSFLRIALIAFSLLITGYFVLWNLSQIAMSPLAAVALWRHRQRHTRRARGLASGVAAPPFVSIVVPAYNEELTLVESIRTLLALDYEPREVVIVNDGSTDGTLPLLQRTFQLVPAPLAFVQPLRSEPVRGIYRSVSEPDLVVVDKANGGSKADASNAGINAASGVLVLIIDADTVLEPDALSRAVLPFLEDPLTVAVGANVAIANGCHIEHGRIVDVALPRNWFARFQVVEYMRSFLLFRLACASQNAVVLISGAFGLFRREAVIAVGGFDRTAIGEDMDLTIRLQRHFRARREPIWIAFDPNPLAWTQAPEDWQSLYSQRCRWRRGLLQVLWRYRRMIGNPRFGTVGLGSLPYVAFFEGLGPLLESGGYIVTILGAALGYLNWEYFRMMVAASMLFGAAVTLLAVLLSDATSRQYARGRDLMLLVAVAILESFGYRQLNALWACVGTVRALTGKGGWGPMKRRAFRT